MRALVDGLATFLTRQLSERLDRPLSDRCHVTFERYDEGLIITDERGTAAFEGGAKVAYFRDPGGNTLSIAQAPRP
jgi:hypothetical protein